MDTVLKRSLTLTDLTLFGVAYIMGSGGFNLIGEGVRSGGAMWPVTLGIPAVLLMGSAFTYAGAFDRFKENTSESDIIRSVFGPWAEGIGTIAILVYNIVSIIVILVFCSKLMLPSAPWISQVSLTLFFLVAMAYLGLAGIDCNKQIIELFSWSLIGILVLATLLGGVGALTQPSATPSMPTHAGFMNSLWMFFFILVGFNAIVTFADETKDKTDIPAAFYLSNGISILLTAGVALAIATWLPNLTGAQESKAIGFLFSKFLGSWFMGPFTWITLAFLLTTTFVVFLATTRYLYGLGDTFPALKEVNAAKAPWAAIASVFGCGSVLALLNNTELLIIITDLGFAVIAALVAGSVAITDWREGKLGSAAVSGATSAGFLGLITAAFL